MIADIEYISNHLGNRAPEFHEETFSQRHNESEADETQFFSCQ